MSGITVKINGGLVNGFSGMTILEIASENKIDIPTLCYLKDYSPVGACRLCVVEVEGSRALVGSCHTPAIDGMVIQTNSLKVLQARRVILELMMSSHPESCIVCEAANCCELRMRAMEMDIGLPRFRTRLHYYPTEDENPHMIRDMSKCILCRRCIKGCHGMSVNKLFSLGDRGYETKVIYDMNKPFSSQAQCSDYDSCISLCPTGALRRPTKFGQVKKGQALYIKG